MVCTCFSAVGSGNNIICIHWLEQQYYKCWWGIELCFWMVYTSRTAALWDFQEYPFYLALLIGGSQYLPEVLQKRIKLTLHLPLNEIVMLYTMVLYGFLMILSLMVIFMILFFTIDLYFFPVEMHIMAINAFLPWILGGFTTYFFVAMIAMNPVGNSGVYTRSWLWIIGYLPVGR